MLGLGVEVALPGARTVCHVEREAYAAAILASRMEAAELAQAPIWTDVATFDARRWRGAVDCVLSGDPCQPNSVAGKRGGADDDRFLIDQVVRIFDESGAGRLFRENVTGNADGQLAALVPALERLGCRVAVGIWRASDVGAAHGRERLFVMADREGDQRWSEQQARGARSRRSGPAGSGQGMADARGARPGDHHGATEGCGGSDVDTGPTSLRPRDGPHGADGPDAASRDLADANGGFAGNGKLQRSGQQRLLAEGNGTCGIAFAPGPNDGRWPTILERAPHLEPAVRRMADGLANRVDRLRACGNGVVPLAAAYAWRSLDALLAEGRDAGEIAMTEAA
ncbi:DNA cytosine methyltransferase [Sphingomonas sp. URHD0057]|uniref:DNA cytosine methyltransferase n=1 Tax=Sphingomonas sp. URHD0057 TaxID=1380389 RepID=UPI003FA6C1E4